MDTVSRYKYQEIYLSGSSNTYDVAIDESVRLDGKQVLDYDGTNFNRHIRTGGGDDIVNSRTSGEFTPTSSNYTGGGTQRHIWGQDGNDTINLIFSTTDGNDGSGKSKKGYHLGWGHHVYGGDGEDVIDFKDTGNVKNGALIFGRVDDFDPTRDTLKFEGRTIDLNNLASNMKIIEFQNDSDTTGGNDEQWLLMETSGGGYLLYSLYGSRANSNGKDNNHFTSQDDIDRLFDNKDFDSIASVSYKDPENFVPKHSFSGATVEKYEESGVTYFKLSDTPDYNKLSKATYNRLKNFMKSEGWDAEASIAHERFSNATGIYRPQDNNALVGGRGDDVINALGGSDYVIAGGGNDLVAGGNSNDWLYGGSGNDKLWGGTEDDRLYGGRGNNILYGGAGNDYLRADNGENTIFGGAGSDTVSYYSWKSKNGEVLTVDLSRKHKNGGFANNDGDYIDNDIENVSGSNGYGDRLTGDNRANVIKGYGGDDYLYGGGGDDLIKGYEDDDRIYGGEGNDKLYGGDGDDRLYSRLGNDEVYGDAGDDYLRADNGDNWIYGGPGSDDVSYYSWKSKNGEVLTVDFSRKDDKGGYFNNDSDYIHTDIENLSGSNGYGDLLTGNDNANVIKGFGGDDYLYGGGGNDQLYGHEGDDILYGGDGDDRLEGREGDDVIDAGASSGGWQLLRGGTGSDQYRVEKDNGKVSIREESFHGSGENDAIVFNDTTFADWTITEGKKSNGEDRLEFTLKSDSSTEIHVYDFDHIEHFKFSDGSDYTSADDLLF